MPNGLAKGVLGANQRGVRDPCQRDYIARRAKHVSLVWQLLHRFTAVIHSDTVTTHTSQSHTRRRVSRHPIESPSSPQARKQDTRYGGRNEGECGVPPGTTPGTTPSPNPHGAPPSTQGGG